MSLIMPVHLSLYLRYFTIRDALVGRGAGYGLNGPGFSFGQGQTAFLYSVQYRLREPPGLKSHIYIYI
jgi:hypothetical protein